MNLTKLDENKWVNTVVELRKPLFVIALLWGSSLAVMLFSEIARAELRCDCSQVVDTCSATVGLQDMSVGIESNSDACSRVDYLIDGQPFSALVVGGSAQVGWPGQPLSDPKIVVENCRVCADTKSVSAANNPAAGSADEAAVPAGDRSLEVVVKVMPEYPRDAWMNRVEGDVTVKFNVNTAGVVEKIRVVGATNQTFVNNSIDAISRFRYAPAMVDGKAVATADVSEQFRFRIVGGVDPVVRSVGQ
jgi:TonB family protein